MIYIFILITLVLIPAFSCNNKDNKLSSGPFANSISDDSLLSLVQHHTFEYFWDGAEPVSGMARERFHGAWPHWIYGETGKVKPFSPKDNGADIVETAYLIQGLLSVRQYFKDGNENEKELAADIDKLWKEVEWSWFTKERENVIYWHWSPDLGWEMNFPVQGYNECLILYVLAASSPT